MKPVLCLGLLVCCVWKIISCKGTCAFKVGLNFWRL